MSMGDPSSSPDRPRWRDDPTIGRTVRPAELVRGAPAPAPARSAAPGGSLDITRDSDVPISTQLYWQLAYQIDTGRLHPGSRLPAVRELGAILHVNPNTVRAVYKRLAEAGYVVSRQGAGTRVTARAPQRRTSGALEGLVADLLRTAARSGYSADEVASAVYSAAAERKRPGPRIEILFVECTTADAQRAAERIAESFDGLADADGVLIDLVDDRLARFHYDLVATSTFHADETIALVNGRAPVIAMLAAPSYAELLDEVRALPRGSRVGLVCATERSTQNIAHWLQESGRGRRGAADRAPGRRTGPRPCRPVRRPAAPDPRGARDRAGLPFRPPGADPRVDLRPGPGRDRAAAPRDRSDPGVARTERRCWPRESTPERNSAARRGLTAHGAGVRPCTGRPRTGQRLRFGSTRALVADDGSSAASERAAATRSPSRTAGEHRRLPREQLRSRESSLTHR